MLAVKVFVDTNVLLYSHDRTNLEKARQSKIWLRELAAHGAAVVNLQVQNELTHVLLRKNWLKTPEETFSIVANLAELGDSPLTRREVREARQLHLRSRYSWWDCLLLASALELGCTHFLSEDMRDGQTIESLTIVNPFAHSPDQILIPR
jgi:predicted nucleic acid-binding protein